MTIRCGRLASSKKPLLAWQGFPSQHLLWRARSAGAIKRLLVLEATLGKMVK
jgi:hypothetical protein